MHQVWEVPTENKEEETWDIAQQKHRNCEVRTEKARDKGGTMLSSSNNIVLCLQRRRRERGRAA